MVTPAGIEEDARAFAAGEAVQASPVRSVIASRVSGAGIPTVPPDKLWQQTNRANRG